MIFRMVKIFIYISDVKLVFFCDNVYLFSFSVENSIDISESPYLAILKVN